MSSSGSSPVVAATWLISASRVSATARRVEGRRRGLATLRAGLSLSLISPSSSACRYRQRSAAMRFSAALRPPRALRRGTTFARTCATSCLISDGVGSSRRRVAPLLDNPVPVGAVRLAGAVGDRGGHDRDVVGEGRHGRPLPRGGGQVLQGQAHRLQDQQRRVHGGLLGRGRGSRGGGHGCPPCAMRERAVGADGLVHHGEGVGGERVLAQELRPAAPGRRAAGRSGGAARRESRCTHGRAGSPCRPGRGGRSPRPRRRSGSAGHRRASPARW